MRPKMDEYTKAAILRAVHGGMMSRADACRRHMLSGDEISLWEIAFEHEGIVGLRDRRLTARRRATATHLKSFAG